MKESDDIINAIDGLIFERRKNTLSNHFKTWFKHDENRFYGNTTDNKFEIWRFTIGAQGMHPVISGEIKNNPDKTSILLKPKMNPVGIYQLIFTMLGLVAIFYNIIASQAGGEELSSILFITFLLFLLIMLVRFIYRYETKAHLNQLIELIDERTGKKQEYKVETPTFM